MGRTILMTKALLVYVQEIFLKALYIIFKVYTLLLHATRSDRVVSPRTTKSKLKMVKRFLKIGM